MNTIFILCVFFVASLLLPLLFCLSKNERQERTAFRFYMCYAMLVIVWALTMRQA